MCGKKEGEWLSAYTPGSTQLSAGLGVHAVRLGLCGGHIHGLAARLPVGVAHDHLDAVRHTRLDAAGGGRTRHALAGAKRGCGGDGWGAACATD